VAHQLTISCAAHGAEAVGEVGYGMRGGSPMVLVGLL